MSFHVEESRPTLVYGGDLNVVTWQVDWALPKKEVGAVTRGKHRLSNFVDNKWNYYYIYIRLWSCTVYKDFNSQSKF